MSPQSILENNLAQVHELGKSKSWKWCIFANAHQKTQFRLNQTFVVQVEVSSKPCYKTLKLVSRHFKPKSFSKGHTSCLSQQIWLYSSERNYISKVKFWTSAKTTSGKFFGRRLGIHLNPKTFWKNLRFQEIDMRKIRIQTSKRNWNKLLPRRLSPNNGVRAIQSFTLTKSKIFCRGHFVENSHQNCVSGFQTVITFSVQMFCNPTSSFKTAKSSLKTAETSKVTFVF